MSGYLGDLSLQQEEALSEFKISLSDVLEATHSDRLLLQFLRARCFDLKRSENMFRNHLQWRKKFPVEKMLHNYEIPEVLKEHMKIPVLGFDKAGIPVISVPVADYDLKGLVNSNSIRGLQEYIFHLFDRINEQANEYNKQFNRVVETKTFIFDLADMKLKPLLHKPVYDWLIGMLKMYEANFPENLEVVYVINIPYFFSWIFNIVKSIASEQTVRKIKVFGSDGWQKELLKNIDAEILPVYLSGTRTDTDDDPDSCSTRGTLGPIPESYYLRNKCRLNADDDAVRQVCLRRRERQMFPVYADEPGCTIVWEVECLNQELNVGLFYQAKDLVGRTPNSQENMEEIVPLHRVGGHLGPSDGSYVNKKSGMYALILDNSFSIFRSKCVLYKLHVLSSVTSAADNDDDANIMTATVCG